MQPGGDMLLPSTVATGIRMSCLARDCLGGHVKLWDTRIRVTGRQTSNVGGYKGEVLAHMLK